MRAKSKSLNMGLAFLQYINEDKTFSQMQKSVNTNYFKIAAV